jgi:hypothetical protein
MSPREAAAAAAVADVLGAGADETIQSYVAGVVSDDHFDWADVADALAPILVRFCFLLLGRGCCCCCVCLLL